MTASKSTGAIRARAMRRNHLLRPKGQRILLGCGAPLIDCGRCPWEKVDVSLNVVLPASWRASRLRCRALAFDQHQVSIHRRGWKDLSLAADPIDLDAGDLGTWSQAEVQA